MLTKKSISIVIITFNRIKELNELLDNIAELDHKDDYLDKVLLLNNVSTISYEEVEKKIKNINSYNVDYVFSKENLGVARGRNYGIKACNSQIIVFIDDDAIFSNKNALATIHDYFSQAPNTIGAIAFKVLYYDTLQFQVTAFPHKKFKQFHQSANFKTSYFIGAGHAIKKEVLNKTELYPEDIFYGMEEYDLSFQIINAGYEIEYYSGVEILHKESPLGRQSSNKKMQMSWINKSKIAWKYLPTIYFITTSILWSLEYLKKTKLNIAEFIYIWLKVIQIPRNVKKQRINKKAMNYLRKVQARLWY
jgi:GT2 family glycosyltransferase